MLVLTSLTIIKLLAFASTLITNTVQVFSKWIDTLSRCGTWSNWKKDTLTYSFLCIVKSFNNNKKCLQHESFSEASLYSQESVIAQDWTKTFTKKLKRFCAKNSVQQMFQVEGFNEVSCRIFLFHKASWSIYTIESHQQQRFFAFPKSTSDEKLAWFRRRKKKKIVASRSLALLFWALFVRKRLWKYVCFCWPGKKLRSRVCQKLFLFDSNMFKCVISSNFF